MRTIITVALAVVLSSCATERPAQAAALDPANPAAPEAPPPSMLTPLGSPGPAPKEDAPKTEALYTCPMHPEVVSPKPGKCPKCGMKLVPKTSGPTPDKAK